MGTALHATATKRAKVAKSSGPRIAALPGRVLGLDYGRRRIGLAISDELRITARPAGILERKNRRDVFRNLREIARGHGARQIVVGYPLNLDGTAGEMAEEAARFAARLRKELGVIVELVDERLTSWAAHQEMAETARATKRDERRTAPETDDLAAAILLRDYLGRERPQKHPTSRGGEK
jgi:putative holliday junction resolvase